MKQQEQYPFAGYDEIVLEVVNQTVGPNIIEIGIGSGNISKQLYDLGYKVTGLDFSSELLKLAGKKMPEAELILYDAHQPFPKFNKRFNTVIMTYFIHHFPIEKQIELIKECLRISDKVILGDVMTSTLIEMNWAQQKDNNLWDDEEFYIVVSDYQGLLEEHQLEFMPKSYCSGVLIISK